MPAIDCVRSAHGTTSKTPCLDSIHGTAAHSHPFGEMPVHAMTKAAVFLPLQILKKAWNPHGVPSFSYWQEKMIAYFVAYFSHIFAYFSHNFAYFDFPFHRIISPPPCTEVLFPMCPSSQWVPGFFSTMCSALLMLIMLCGSLKRPVMMWRA